MIATSSWIFIQHIRIGAAFAVIPPFDPTDKLSSVGIGQAAGTGGTGKQSIRTETWIIDSESLV